MSMPMHKEQAMILSYRKQLEELEVGLQRQIIQATHNLDRAILMETEKTKAVRLLVAACNQNGGELRIAKEHHDVPEGSGISIHVSDGVAVIKAVPPPAPKPEEPKLVTP